MRNIHRILYAVLFLLTSSLPLGCTISLKNGGKVGFEQSTSWAFFHDAINRDDASCESGVDFPSIEDWIKSKTACPVCPTCDSVTVTTTTTEDPVATP